MLGQERSAGAGCVEMERDYPFPLPARDTPPSTKAVRAMLRLNGIDVTESEWLEPDADNNYHAEIEVQGESAVTSYLIRDLIPNGGPFRLLLAKSLCSGPDSGTLLLGFEAGWTGGSQSFVLIQFSRGSFKVIGIPRVRHGKLVIYRRDPNRIELWSASSKEEQTCEACGKHYIITECRVENGIRQCKSPREADGLYAPNAVGASMIDIR